MKKAPDIALDSWPGPFVEQNIEEELVPSPKLGLERVGVTTCMPLFVVASGDLIRMHHLAQIDTATTL